MRRPSPIRRAKVSHFLVGLGLFTFASARADWDPLLRAAQYYRAMDSGGCLAVADVGGDGLPDLLIPKNFGNQISIMKHSLPPHYQVLLQPASLLPTTSNTVDLATADFNLDGREDLVTCDQAPAIRVRLGSGASYSPEKSYPLTGFLGDVVTGDVNNDGRPDVVVHRFGSSTGIYVLLGVNGDSLAPAASYPVPMDATARAPLALGDVTGDGFLDVVIGDQNGSNDARIWVLPGLGTGAFSTVLGPLDVGAAVVSSIALAHLNADTIRDIAVGSGSATGLAIRIWLASGGGSFGSPTVLAHEGTLSIVCTGDIDGDGDADLVAACWPLADTFRSVAVFKNQGAATFTGPTYYAGLQGASDATLVDMDQDGWLDLVASTGDPNFSSNSVAILRNDGQGGFESGKVAVALDDFDVHTIADFNRDGKPDMAAGVANGVAVGLGNGDGTFALTGETLGFFRTGRLFAGDITGDGIPDLVIGAYIDGAPFIGYCLPGLGNGSFGSTISIPDIPQAVFDINRDGRLDVLGYAGGGALTAMINNGSGFTRAGVFGTSVGFDAFALGDWDRDGDTDFAVVGDGGLAVFHYDASQVTFVQTVIQSGVDYSDVCAGDFDRDGILDLAVRSGSVRIFRGGAGGSFSFDRLLTTLEGGLTVRTWDANLDGRLDLMATGMNPLIQYLSADLFLGGGHGEFMLRATYAVGNQLAPTLHITVGDVDRNGANDILAPVFGYEGNPLRGLQTVLASPPTKGNAYQDAAIYTTLANPRTVAIGDVNRDGKLDVVSGSPGQNPGVAVRLNADLGALGPSTTLAQSWNTGHLELADFNRDGKLDIATSNTGFGPRVSTMLGVGDGTFGARMDYFINAGLDFEVGDMNRDGFLDIVTASQDSIQLLIGNGTGTFTAGAIAAINPCYDLDLADLNRDGWLDVVCAGGAVRVFYNNSSMGSVFSAPQTLVAPISTCQSVCVGDFNRDGILDIEACENGVYYIFWGAETSPPYSTYATTTLTFGQLDVQLGEAESNGIPFLYISNNTGFVAVVRVETNGTLTPVGTYTVLDTPIAVALGDVNGDASVDFVSAGSGTSFLAVNLHGFGSITAVETPPPPASSRPALRQNYPNPFNPRTTIRFELPRADHARLRIYDVHGRLVATLHDGPAPAGVSLVEWRGQSDRGVPVASGVYHYELVTASGQRESRKMVVMK